MTKDKLLFVNLTTKQTFLEWGRIFFSVINAFSESGYKILLLKNDAIENLDVYGQPVLDLKNLDVVQTIPEHPEKYLYLYDEKNSHFNNMMWEKQTFLKYDLFSRYWFEQPMIMPFPVHPLQEVYGYTHRLDELRRQQRQFRILFAGDIKDYKRTWINYPKEKLPRQKIIETILEQLGDENLQLINDEKSLESAMKADYLNKFVIIDNDSQRIDNKIWLDTLAKAQFFFSPPGIVMPMCHNIVEAMAIGSIPITNYPEWFHPNLEHGVNCIVFDDKKDLLNKINSVLSMDESTILDMKNNAIEYYEKHLKKAEFINKVEAYPNNNLTVLYYTEGNVAKNKKKLNKHSVLMRDTSIPMRESGIRYQVMRLLGRI